MVGDWWSMLLLLAFLRGILVVQLVINDVTFI